jgi:homoprotocatechuate degradation regulator HpaR
MAEPTPLPPYSSSLAGVLLAAREAVMAPLREHLRKADLTDQQWRTLRVLAEAELLDAKGIAEQALLYPPTVTRILKELAERKLITRASDPDDGRRSVISITDLGRELVVNTSRHTRVLLDQYAAAFGAERLKTFTTEALAMIATLESFRPRD